jgi:hypothetical protein
MKQHKTIYSYEDLTEVLAEHAIGTDVMKEIEDFCQNRKNHVDYLRRRLQKAEELLGSYMLDEHMIYE